MAGVQRWIVKRYCVRFMKIAHGYVGNLKWDLMNALMSAMLTYHKPHLGYFVLSLFPRDKLITFMKYRDRELSNLAGK